MMRVIGILLKKELGERVSGLKNAKKDIVGSILNVLLTIFVLGVFISAFSYFISTYTSVKIGYITDKSERVFEIITIFFAMIFILLAIVGIARLNKNLIDVGNLTLLAMPITPFQIFISKMIVVYFELALTSLIVTFPTILLLIIQGLLPWGVVFVATVLALLVPVIVLCIASIFTIPFYFFKRWINKHVIIQLIFYILLMVGAFSLYSIFLRFIKGLIESGQISFFFNEDMVLKIGKLCKYLFPANILSSLMVGKNILLNLLILVVALGGSAVVCYYISKSIFTLVRQNRIGSRNYYTLKKIVRQPRKVTTSLMTKEYLNVIRTPSLAFNYFAIVLSLPLMVVITAGLMCSMMKELTLLNCDYEIVLCVISMYSIILNTFCANNISRDGKFFNLLKTFPISPRRVVFSKILFCSITSFVSLLATSIAILVTGLLSPLKILAVFVICLLLNVGVICLATRKDLNTTKNRTGEENKSSINFLIFWGLAFSVVTTIISFVFSLYLQTRFNLLVSNLISSVVLLGISICVFVFSIIYLLRNLDKKFKEILL